MSEGCWRRTEPVRTVYLAHDLRHNRKVAVKVLRDELFAYPEPTERRVT